MDKKQLLEQNLNIFLENYIADLLAYCKNDAEIAELLAQKNKLAAQLKELSPLFFDYDDIQNALLHAVAKMFYKNGFFDAVKLQKKLK